MDQTYLESLKENDKIEFRGLTGIIIRRNSQNFLAQRKDSERILLWEDPRRKEMLVIAGRKRGVLTVHGKLGKIVLYKPILRISWLTSHYRSVTYELADESLKRKGL